MPRGKGRPTKFTPERRNQIISLIKAGNYLDTACQASGVTYSAFREWMKRGELEYERIMEANTSKPKKSEQEFLDFFEAVQKAEATAEARNLTIINKAAEKNWQAAAWYLERRAPDRWGRRDRVQAELNHTGKVDGDLSYSMKGLSTEELKRLAQLDEE